ncbi:MAG: hypothetical protein E5X46_17720 [Mesorhizobium sp.]|nr:MAG: hypothetical protein E5X47_16710 [Mesorhizobium sp.]TIQ56881.1 MAG: hypothetical protein E5X46_17720 [Mesorhizobium sp.]
MIEGLRPEPGGRRRDSAPLCPAGYLPHLGGDRTSRRLSPTTIAKEAPREKPVISPLVGEMSGRTEGGAKERCLTV